MIARHAWFMHFGCHNLCVAEGGAVTEDGDGNGNGGAGAPETQGA